MHDTNSTLSCKSPDRYIGQRLHPIIRTVDPEPRSLCERLKITGKSKAAFDSANNKRWDFADWRITVATKIAILSGQVITRSLIQGLAGCSAHTANKHSYIWKENLHELLQSVGSWDIGWLINQIKFLTSWHAVQAVIKASVIQVPTTGGGVVSASVPPRVSFFASLSTENRPSGISAGIVMRVVSAIVGNTAKCPEGDGAARRNPRHRQVTRSLAARFMEAMNDLKARTTKAYQAAAATLNLSRPALTGESAQGDREARAIREAIAQGLTTLDEDTGEITMQDRSVVWCPGPGNQKPPGSPWPGSSPKEKKKKEIAARNIHLDTVNISAFPLDAPPLADKPTDLIPAPPRQETPQQRPGAWQLPPPDIAAQIKALSEKFTMDRERRESKLQRAERKGKLTHLQRLELSDSPNEEWFRKNATFINDIRTGALLT